MEISENKVVSDSLWMEIYKRRIQMDYFDEADSLSDEERNLIFENDRMYFRNEKVVYAPDASFKIFTIELESCGAYCNSEWFSWIHYNLKTKEQIKKTAFSFIDSMYVLPNNQYLIVDSYGARPASVLTVTCLAAHHISFANDSLVMHTIPYRNLDFFEFCQENGIETETFIRYDSAQKTLNYAYGNNYAYAQNLDIDTIRKGQFKLQQNHFVLDKETIEVINRE
uniref:hypothetical protein n=1 Tax=Flavobacterium sp. TaxID=239 RepID=UPI004049D053